MNKQLFKYYQALNRENNTDTAKALNITIPTLSSRLSGKRGVFTVKDISLLRARWGLTVEQCADIFLTND